MSGLQSCEAIAGLIESGRIPWRSDGYLCFTREQADLRDPDHATAQTIARMSRQTAESIGRPRVTRFAHKSVETWKGGPVYVSRPLNWGDERVLACSVWYGVHSSLRFVEHSEQIRALLNERDQLQLLIPPEILLRSKRPAGDCAVYTPLVCASLGTLGIHYEFVTVACDPREPDVFTHVYCRAVLSDGSRIVMDASHGKYPGWEVPREHQIRKQVWSESGEPVADQGRTFVPLGQYRRVKRVLPRRLLGMGQVAPDSSVDMTGTDIGILTGADIAANPPPLSLPPVMTGSPAPGFNWDQSLASFLNQGIKLAGQVVAPQVTMMRGPGGQLYYQAPAGSSAAVPAAGLLTPTGGGSWLMIGGAVIVGILVLSSLTKGRR